MPGTVATALQILDVAEFESFGEVLRVGPFGMLDPILLPGRVSQYAIIGFPFDFIDEQTRLEDDVVSNVRSQSAARHTNAENNRTGDQLGPHHALPFHKDVPDGTPARVFDGFIVDRPFQWAGGDKLCRLLSVYR